MLTERKVSYNRFNASAGRDYSGTWSRMGWCLCHPDHERHETCTEIMQHVARSSDFFKSEILIFYFTYLTLNEFTHG